MFSSLLPSLLRLACVLGVGGIALLLSQPSCTQEVFCTEDGECPSRRCLGGLCKPLKPCKVTADCPSPRLCKDGSCLLPSSEPSSEPRTETTAEGRSDGGESLPEISKDALEILLPSGTFQRGSPSTELGRDVGESEDQHKVTLTQAFYIHKHEIKQGDFQTTGGYNPSFHKGGLDHPVDSVSWHEAAAYANKLSERKGFEPCFACTGQEKTTDCVARPSYQGADYYICPGYRLPTEAEWEYAYRAGVATAFYNGGITVPGGCSPADTNALLIGWHGCNSNGVTHAIGQKIPNEWGLYDMAGNVWEWVYDSKGSYPTQPVTDPIEEPTGQSRILRGGSWDSSNALDLRAAYRGTRTPTERDKTVGFRLVRTAPSTTCKAGTSLCKGFCANLQTNHLHCGACEKVCLPGKACKSGSCG